MIVHECCYLCAGLLCGQCDEGYGVGLLTNECKQFPDRVPQFWLFPIYCEHMLKLTLDVHVYIQLEYMT